MKSKWHVMLSSSWCVKEKGNWKAIAMKPRERSERKPGTWAFAHGKFYEATPFRMSENALLQSRIQLVFLIDLYSE